MANEQESTQELAEAKAPPTPQLSQVSEVQPPSAPSLDVGSLKQELVEAIRAELRQEVERTAQSQKDRACAHVGKSLEEIKVYLEEAKGDTKQAARNIMLDQLASREQTSPADPGRSNEEVEADTASILDKFKVPYDDAGLGDLAAKQYPSAPEWKATVERYAIQFQKRAKPANVAQGVPGKAPLEGVASPRTVESPFIAKLEAMRGRTLSPAELKERERLRSELFKFTPRRDDV